MTLSCYGALEIVCVLLLLLLLLIHNNVKGYGVAITMPEWRTAANCAESSLVISKN